MPTRVRKPQTENEVIAAAEIIRNFGHWQQQAVDRPLTITHHGRARVMLISTDTYERLLAAQQAAPGAASGTDRVTALTDNMAEGFVQHDGELRIVEVNRVAERYFRLSRAQMLGRSVSDATWSDGHTFIQSQIRRVLLTGEMVRYEVESKLFPGRRISLRSFPYRDGVATLFVNITERERLRAAAEDMDAFERSLAALGTIGLLKLNARGGPVWADAQFEKLTGFTVAQLALGKLINPIVVADRRHAQAAFDDLVRNGKSAVVTVRVIVRSGEERRLTLALAPVMRDFAMTGAMLFVAEAPLEA